jgi:cell wall-associated NlpC family hydrolase
MLDLSPNERQPFQWWALSYLGAPFEALGRGPAYDCWGLAREVQRRHFARDLPDYLDAYRAADYAARRDLDALIGAEREGFVEVASVQPGAVLLCALYGHIMHVATACGGGRALHIRRGADAVIEPLHVSRGAVRLGSGFVVRHAYAAERVSCA